MSESTLFKPHCKGYCVCKGEYAPTFYARRNTNPPKISSIGLNPSLTKWRRQCKSSITNYMVNKVYIACDRYVGICAHALSHLNGKRVGSTELTNSVRSMLKYHQIVPCFLRMRRSHRQSHGAHWGGVHLHGPHSNFDHDRGPPPRNVDH